MRHDADVLDSERREALAVLILPDVAEVRERLVRERLELRLVGLELSDQVLVGRLMRAGGQRDGEREQDASSHARSDSTARTTCAAASGARPGKRCGAPSIL